MLPGKSKIMYEDSRYRILLYDLSDEATYRYYWYRNGVRIDMKIDGPVVELQQRRWFLKSYWSVLGQTNVYSVVCGWVDKFFLKEVKTNGIEKE